MIWTVIVVTGICTLFSLYMALLAFKNNDSGIFLFAAFGLFFGIPFIYALIKVISGRWAFLKRMDEKISETPKPVSFVPHWFIMAAIMIAIIAVLAAIFIPIFTR